MWRLWKNVCLLFLLPVLLLTACMGREGAEGQNTGDGIPANMTENSTGNEKREDIAACDGTAVSQMIETSAGGVISIDAQVDLDGISRVSRYKYIPVQFTEDGRKALLKQWFPAETWDVLKAAVYIEPEKRWEFTTPIGASCIYQIICSESSEEQILNVEVLNENLDYKSENIISPVRISPEFINRLTEEALLLDEVTGRSPDEIEQVGQSIITTAGGRDTYSCSYLYICKERGEHRYAKAVFKQIVDGMPVTTYHDFATITTDYISWPIKGWGGLFTVEEIGLDKQILTPEEAVAAMRKQIDTVAMQETEICVTKIGLEYLTVISADGTLEIVPVWRFWIGDDEMERLMLCEQILAVNAVNGELIWENRAPFGE